MNVVETERLILRRIESGDVDNLLGIFADPEAMRYYPGTKSRAETESWIAWNLGSYREHGFGLWAAVLCLRNRARRIAYPRPSLSSPTPLTVMGLTVLPCIRPKGHVRGVHLLHQNLATLYRSA